MKRRTFIAASATAMAASTFPAPAITQSVRELKLVSTYPAMPSTELLAKTITGISGGRLKITLFNAGELVGPFEVFDAVSEGLADMYVGNEYYWQDRSPAFTFFTTVPFGLTAIEMYSWIYWGGGQKLWDELSANYNLKPFPSDVGENQMGGWYNKEIKSVEDFKGLRLRMPGLGGELMRRMGATVINLPADEIVPALNSGALDAAEWVGPDLDMMLGLHTAAKYYYYPGIHEPGNVQSVAINKTVWDSLASEERKLIESALAGGLTYGLMLRHLRQMEALPVLLKEHSVQLRRFNDKILQTLGKMSGEVVADIGSRDPFTKRVYDSYISFRKASRDWTDISQRAYLNARALDFPYGN